jgi:hypothetical protein
VLIYGLLYHVYPSPRATAAFPPAGFLP